MVNKNIKRIITPEVFVAYFQCKRKAYSLLFENIKSNSHEYADILDKNTKKAKLAYLKIAKQKYSDRKPYSIEEIQRGICTLLDAKLIFGNYEANADLLVKENRSVHDHYLPTIVIGSCKVNKEHKLWLIFVAYVLSRIQGIKPNYGVVVDRVGRTHRIKVEYLYKEVDIFLRVVNGWESGRKDAPAIILNRH